MIHNKTTVDVLEYALQFIRHGWTKNCMAVDAQDKQIHERSSGAVKFCAVGAITRSSMNKILIDESINLLLSANRLDSVTVWNDSPSRKKREVEAGFRKAIALTKKNRKISQESATR